MATAIISTRLEEDEIALIDSLGQLVGFDRSTVLKSILRKGISEMRFELAVEKYRSQLITLSKASEISGLSQWGFIARMSETGLELHYGAEDFHEDLSSLPSSR